MAELISLLLFIALTGSITYYGYRRYARPGRMLRQLSGEEVSIPLVGADPDAAGPGLLVSAVEYIGQALPLMPTDASVVRNDLMAAGYRSDRAYMLFSGARVLTCASLTLLALTFASSITANPILRIVIPIAAAVVGFLGPTFYLDHLVNRRQDHLREGLPDAIDLMVVSVEAGLGLDQAILYVARELSTAHPVVSEELQLVNLEIRAGQRRAEALRHMAQRTGEAEMRKLAAMLIQTDRFGTSIGEALRTHSDFMRTHRRQLAEEKAGKVGVKLVFPIFFLILPAMLIVTTGPGLLQVFKFLLPMLREAAL